MLLVLLPLSRQNPDEQLKLICQNIANARLLKLKDGVAFHKLIGKRKN